MIKAFILQVVFDYRNNDKYTTNVITFKIVIENNNPDSDTQFRHV